MLTIMSTIIRVKNATAAILPISRPFVLVRSGEVDCPILGELVEHAESGFAEKDISSDTFFPLDKKRAKFTCSGVKQN